MSTNSIRIRRLPAQAVELPHQHRAAAAKVIKALIELRAVLEGTGADVLVDAHSTGVMYRIELQREILSSH